MPHNPKHSVTTVSLHLYHLSGSEFFPLTALHTPWPGPISCPSPIPKLSQCDLLHSLFLKCFLHPFSPDWMLALLQRSPLKRRLYLLWASQAPQDLVEGSLSSLPIVWNTQIFWPTCIFLSSFQKLAHQKMPVLMRKIFQRLETCKRSLKYKNLP